jgi:mono/diheme cytochrome c family protein
MKKITAILVIISGIFLYNCGGAAEQKQSAANEKTAPVPVLDPNDPRNDKGIGPVRMIVLEDINAQMATEGEQIYKEKCLACHKPTEKFIGPAPLGILDRRSPEWIMNMILNPEEMVKSDPIAMKLLEDFNRVPMTNQHLTAGESRKVLEYFRTLK